MVKTQSTSDYSIFKKHLSNRPINEAAVTKLMASIKAKNLLEYRPMLVDGGLHVVDGQHRLEAAKRLGIPIYYQVSEDANDEDMLGLNQGVSLWGISDFLHYFVSKGKPDYIKFKDFIEKKRLQCRMGLRVLMNGNHSKIAVQQFKNGKFEFPKAEILDEVEELFLKYSDIVELINTKKMKGNLITSVTHFKNGLLDFLRNKEIDYMAFKRRLEINLQKLCKCAGPMEYVALFKEIYNWKNRHDKFENIEASNF